jgi:hypothetical protein
VSLVVLVALIIIYQQKRAESSFESKCRAKQELVIQQQQAG